LYPPVYTLTIALLQERMMKGEITQGEEIMVCSLNKEDHEAKHHRKEKLGK
jgi:hypothetical protein